MQRPGSTGNHQRKLARIIAPFDRNTLKRSRHIGVYNAIDTLGSLNRREAQGLGNRICHRALSRVIIERHFPAQQPVWGKIAQHQVGIRHRGFDPATAIAHRTGLGTGTLGPDLEHPPGIDPGNTAPTSANRVDIQ